MTDKLALGAGQKGTLARAARQVSSELAPSVVVAGAVIFFLSLGLLPMPDRILLVEDDPKDVELLLLALERSSLAEEIHVARDGEEALDYLFRKGEYHGCPPVHPSLVILDLKLPKIDGIEVLAAIRENADLKNLRVVVFTSSKEEADVLRSNVLGADAYIVKAPGCANLIDALCKLAQLRHGLKPMGLTATSTEFVTPPHPTLH